LRPCSRQRGKRAPTSQSLVDSASVSRRVAERWCRSSNAHSSDGTPRCRSRTTRLRHRRCVRRPGRGQLLGLHVAARRRRCGSRGGGLPVPAAYHAPRSLDRRRRRGARADGAELTRDARRRRGLRVRSRELDRGRSGRALRTALRQWNGLPERCAVLVARCVRDRASSLAASSSAPCAAATAAYRPTPIATASAMPTTNASRSRWAITPIRIVAVPAARHRRRPRVRQRRCVRDDTRRRASRSERQGCPDGDDDTDHVLNHTDECRTVAMGLHPDPARIGCPLADRDNDSVPDSVDHCPDRPGAPDPNARRNGCPGSCSSSPASFGSCVPFCSRPIAIAFSDAAFPCSRR